jgi:hypothetical protein
MIADYDYYLKLRQLKAPPARAAVYFQNDVVDRVDSDVMPVSSEAAARPGGRAPGRAGRRASRAGGRSERSPASPAAPRPVPPRLPPTDPIRPPPPKVRGGAHSLTTPVARIDAQCPVQFNAVAIARHEVAPAANAPYAGAPSSQSIPPRPRLL